MTVNSTFTTVLAYSHSSPKLKSFVKSIKAQCRKIDRLYSPLAQTLNLPPNDSSGELLELANHCVPGAKAFVKSFLSEIPKDERETSAKYGAIINIWNRRDDNGLIPVSLANRLQKNHPGVLHRWRTVTQGQNLLNQDCAVEPIDDKMWRLMWHSIREYWDDDESEGDAPVMSYFQAC